MLDVVEKTYLNRIIITQGGVQLNELIPDISHVFQTANEPTSVIGYRQLT